MPASLCLQLTDKSLVRDLLALLPAYLPATVHAGPPGIGDLVLRDRAGDFGTAAGELALPPAPFRLGLLLDRIAAALRGVGTPGIAFGPYRLDANSLDLRHAGAVIRLTEKEAALLRRLHEAAGGTVERSELLAGVWGYAEGLDTHTLETHIYRLRQKIEIDPAAPAHLLTEGAGYRLAIRD